MLPRVQSAGRSGLMELRLALRSAGERFWMKGSIWWQKPMKRGVFHMRMSLRIYEVFLRESSLGMRRFS